jgi:hypothetical protein
MGVTGISMWCRHSTTNRSRRVPPANPRYGGCSAAWGSSSREAVSTRPTAGPPPGPSPRTETRPPEREPISPELMVLGPTKAQPLVHRMAARRAPETRHPLRPRPAASRQPHRVLRRGTASRRSRRNPPRRSNGVPCGDVPRACPSSLPIAAGAVTRCEEMLAKRAHPPVQCSCGPR